MGAMFTTLFAKIAATVKWFGDLFIAVFKSLWHLITDVFCWGFESLLLIVSGAIQAIDVSGFNASIGSFSQLPSEILNILMLLGFGECMVIIGVALTIRFGLQLIPFVRLGA